MQKQLFNHLVKAKPLISNAQALAKPFFISVLNQVISSGTNFILGLYLVRALVPADFGLYSIGLAISLFYSGMGNALFLTQMVVHTPDKRPEDREFYAARILVLVCLFCILTFFIASFLFSAFGLLVADNAKYATVGVAVSAASIAYLLKDFFIRHAYNIRNESRALKINVVLATALITTLSFQNYYQLELTVAKALSIYALCHAIASCYAIKCAKFQFGQIERFALMQDIRELWLGGRWASITNLMFFLRSQAHTIIVSMLMGPIDVARLTASRLLITPTVMITPALAQIAMPRLSSLRTTVGTKKLYASAAFVALALLIIAVFYCVLLLVNYDFIVGHIFTEKYTDMFGIVLVWCIYASLLSIKCGLELSLQASKKFKETSSANIVAAFFSLGSTYVFVSLYGLIGALIGLASGELLLLVLIARVMWINCKKSLSNVPT